MNTKSDQSSFSWIRSTFFPVHKHELNKMLSLAIMNLLVAFNFWITHNSKDIIVLTAKGSGAEVINFLKFGVFIFSVAFVLFFTWISNIFTQRSIFYGIITFFMVSFLFFGYYVYPNHHLLHMDIADVEALQASYPYFKWFFPMFGYWGFTLIYIFSEMWGAIVLTYLFWQFANQITSIEQSKRFYMIFSVFNGFGTIVAGYFMLKFSKPTGIDASSSIHEYESTLQGMYDVFGIVCIAVMIVYYWINKTEVTDAQRYHPRSKRPDKDHKIQLSFWQSIKYIASSKYIGYIAIMAIGYNVTLNFTEVTWKKQLELFHDKDAFRIQEFIGNMTIFMGVMMLILGFIGSNVVRRFTWRASALVTPKTILVLGGVFFGFTLLNQFAPDSYLEALIGFSPIIVAVNLGQILLLMTKSSKISFFNVTREMAYIPLDAELKVKGKAAVDVMSGRLGKLGGAAIQAILLSIIPGGTQSSIVPYVFFFFVLMCIIWIMSVNALNREFIDVARKTHQTVDEE